ncbi:hypothetical protein [Algoriphagus sp. CAU 1675]|uniref:hypothetical protein n=1 Tax=Algoriphagus sp. CAU 1675 TaxID=3032597 RepID=UPI0023DA8EC1|nr:hypothetical protein [Algoriphagus sp. CAU 1675]MDF2158540.1 hypothetical protein [Algoriphagus sp. CAU 1675]
MKSLPKNWITEGLIDFEYKKYQLLAYLQESNKQFRQVKLYPVLGELIEHNRNLEELKSGKTRLSELFPKSLTAVDLKNVRLHYEPKEEEGEVMKEINLITDFALPKLKGQIQEGKAIYDFVEEQVIFEPVGIQPIYNREGFVFMTMDRSHEVHAFRYKSGLFQLAGEKFRSISFWLLGIFQRSLVKTLESLKLHLIREVKELPNPATWRLHSTQTFPIEETLVPLSKRLLLQTVTE